MQNSLEATPEEEGESLPWEQEINKDVKIKTEKPDVNDIAREYQEAGNHFSRRGPLRPITLHVREQEVAKKLSESPIPVQLVDTAMIPVEAPIESPPSIPRWEDLLKIYNETVNWMKLPEPMD